MTVLCSFTVESILRSTTGLEPFDQQSEESVTRARAINVRDLRKRNRAQALAAVYHNGPMTRQEIGEATGVSQATVSNLVGDLLDQGVIVEAGAEDSDGGRPRALLRVKPDYRYVVGVDVGETAILVELFDLDMQVQASHSITPTADLLDPEKTAEYVLEGLDRVVMYSGRSENAIIVLLGTGTGASIFTESELYRGASSSAGEWGHTTVMVNGRTCRCGAKGCLEAYVGGWAIVARYDKLRRRTPSGSDTDLVARLTVIAEAPSGDQAAAEVLQET